MNIGLKERHSKDKLNSAICNVCDGPIHTHISIFENQILEPLTVFTGAVTLKRCYISTTTLELHDREIFCVLNSRHKKQLALYWKPDI